MNTLFPTLSPSDRLLIAGPCSAESPGQLLTTARQLQKEVDLRIFRAGVWKPRTAPGGFEGFGEKALGWLCEVRRETGLLVGTEVGTAEHARLALQYGLDYIWIGTRTVTSPFAVEEIAETVDGTDIAVLVKNPLAPDIDLWVGAVNRLLNHGLTRVGAILRGFYVGGESVLRNLPFWHLAEEFRRKAPDGLPLLCDPSHIAGNAAFVPTLIKEAKKRQMDGLIVEAHCNPSEALTDKAQQLLPTELAGILKEVPTTERTHSESEDFELVRLRLLLDKIDEEIIRLLRERFAMTREIGEWKSFHHLPLHQTGREQELYSTRKELARLYDVPDALVEQLYRLIHDSSLEEQTKSTNR